MKARSLALPGLAVAALCSVSLAYIHPGAPASAAAEAVAGAAIHDYMHDVFPSGYGSHGMDVAASELADTLQEWSFGFATECDVEPLVAAADAALADMGSQFLVNGVFLDPTATTMFYDCYIQRGATNAYTQFLLCPPDHGSIVVGQPTTQGLQVKRRR